MLQKSSTDEQKERESEYKKLESNDISEQSSQSITAGPKTALIRANPVTLRVPYISLSPVIMSRAGLTRICR